MTRRPIITHHALVRYLERVVGIDVEAHRRAIEERTALAVEHGACAVVSEGWRYTITDCHVTTVMPRRRDLALPRMLPAEDEA